MSVKTLVRAINLAIAVVAFMGIDLEVFTAPSESQADGATVVEPTAIKEGVEVAPYPLELPLSSPLFCPC